MRAIVSIAGRGSTFYLVQQLLKRGYLEQLITSYPKFEVKKYGIPPAKVTSILSKEIMERGWRRMPKLVKDNWNPAPFIHEWFDRRAAAQLTPADILWCWVSFSLHTLRKAHDLGIKTIVETGNGHQLYLEKTFAEEYAKLNLPSPFKRDVIVERSLQEYETADYIAMPSSYVKRTFLEQGVPEEKIICVPYGVNIQEFKPMPKTDNIFRVVFTGGMSIRKGVHYLMQAFTELNLPQSELILIGSMNEEMRPFFQKYEGKYKWLGHISQQELFKHYSQGSVFVLNSLDDGFGIVIVQAMACGLPLIATTNTGGPDVAEDGKEGFIIPIANVEKLKEKLLFLYEHQELCREMGEAARKKVSSGFTWDDYGDRIVAEFKKIISK